MHCSSSLYHYSMSLALEHASLTSYLFIAQESCHADVFDQRSGAPGEIQRDEGCFVALSSPNKLLVVAHFVQKIKN